MNRKKYLFIVVIGSLLLVSLFVAGSAYASTGCFTDTNGHPVEVHICWLKDNGIAKALAGGTFKPNNNVTRAQLATFLFRANNVPPKVGAIQISSGFSNWQKFHSADPISYSNYANGTYLRSTSVGTYTMVLQPDLPVVLYGRSLKLVGVEICYGAATGNFMSEVRLRTTTQSAGLASSTLSYSDGVDRTDTACRYYVISTPVVMTAEMGAEIFVDLTWTTANTDFGFGRATFVLAPTETIAAAVSDSYDGNNTTTLQEGGSGPEDQRP